MRLKAAADNLTRLDDILQQLETQSKGLERQARQAARYRDLAGAIRRTEALRALIDHREAAQGFAEAEAQLERVARDVEERTNSRGSRASPRGRRLRPAAAPRRRLERGGDLQRLMVAREALDGEEKRATARSSELAQRIAADDQRSRA